MSAACCDQINRCIHEGTAKVDLDLELESKRTAPLINERSGLFNRVTVLLLMAWLGIVAVALETASVGGAHSLPTVELFLKSLL
jgi:hypothetical protein